MHHLPSLHLNFLTSKLDIEWKLLCNSANLEFSVPTQIKHLRSLCLDSPPLCPQFLAGALNCPVIWLGRVSILSYRRMSSVVRMPWGPGPSLPPPTVLTQMGCSEEAQGNINPV